MWADEQSPKAAWPRIRSVLWATPKNEAPHTGPRPVLPKNQGKIMITEMATTHGIAENGKKALDVSKTNGSLAGTVLSQIEDTLGEARTQFETLRHGVEETSKCAAHVTHEYVRQNPWKVVGITAVVGMIIGGLLGRR